MSVVVWEWQNDAGRWLRFTAQVCTQIEANRGTTGSPFSTTRLRLESGRGEDVYTFDLGKNCRRTQEEASCVRKLRRRVEAADEPDITRVKKSRCVASRHKDARDLKPRKVHRAEGSAQLPGGGKDPVGGPVTAPPATVVDTQQGLGAQSLRNQPYGVAAMALLEPHAKRCFDLMLSRERELCGEWAVFYHLYSHVAVVYEVQAAIARVLFGFESEYATLPRRAAGRTNTGCDACHDGDTGPRPQVQTGRHQRRHVTGCDRRRGDAHEEVPRGVRPQAIVPGHARRSVHVDRRAARRET